MNKEQLPSSEKLIPQQNETLFQNKILFLINDTQLLREQLSGKPVSVSDYSLLADGVSTDAIFETRNALTTDPDLGRFALTGLTGIEKGTLQEGGFDVLVAGENFGCGSGREQAVITLKEAGIRFIFAPSFAPIFKQNCINNGIYPLSNFEVLKRMKQREEVFSEEVLSEFDKTQKEILKNGGLLSYSLACLRGEIKPPEIKTGLRPMTMAEKIIVKRLSQANRGFVKPGDSAFLALSSSDTCFSYELHTGLLNSILTTAGRETISNLSSVILFEDHIVWWGHPQTAELLQSQADFVKKYGLKTYYQRSRRVEDNLAAQGICHTLIAENHALPGQITIGTDSHTCTAGALGSLAFCVEPTGIANVSITDRIPLKVPESVKVVFSGRLPKSCTAKDVMLSLLAQCRHNPQITLGKVLEYSGSGIKNMPLDELLVLSNMATEAGAFTGIIEPTDEVIKYLMEKRGLTREEIEKMIVKSDPDAAYSRTIEVELSDIQPMVALPGHPQNSIPLIEAEETEIQGAFIGSCTGGKLYDLRLAAEVLKGRKVNKNVQFIIQAASMGIYKQAIREGLAKIFEEAGAWFLQPACGACIGLGPGRVQENEVVVSASNRNFPNRMGRGGKAYLASPIVVAASAIAGKLSLFS